MVVALWIHSARHRLKSATERLHLLQQDTHVVYIEIQVDRKMVASPLAEKLYETAVSMSQTNKNGKGWRNKVT